MYNNTISIPVSGIKQIKDLFTKYTYIVDF